MDEMNTMLEMSDFDVTTEPMSIEPIESATPETPVQAPSGMNIMTFVKGGAITAVTTWVVINGLEFGKKKVMNAVQSHRLKAAEKKARKAKKKEVDEVIDVEAEIIED